MMALVAVCLIYGTVIGLTDTGPSERLMLPVPSEVLKSHLQHRRNRITLLSGLN